MPTTLLFAPTGVTIAQKRFDLSTMSEASGNTQERLGAPPRWALSLRAPENMTPTNAAIWETVSIQLRGRVNHLSAWDPGRPAPRGTCRGTMTLSGTHNAGVTALTIAVTGQSGNTLLAGDWLQIGSGLTGQLVKITVAGTAGASTIAVTVEPPLRIQYAGATAVTWDKALGHYKQTSSPQWSYRTRDLLTGFSLDLLESWT
jgi:hypothetical protein